MAWSYICKGRTASQMVVNQNISTMMSHKFRAPFIEVTQFEIMTKDIVIL
jgi:hypothetical protein